LAVRKEVKDRSGSALVRDIRRSKMNNIQARLIALPIVMVAGSLFSVVGVEFDLLIGGSVFTVAGIFFVVEYIKSLAKLGTDSR
jgi:hypothetical protein